VARTWYGNVVGRFKFTFDDPDVFWNELKVLAVVVEPLFDTPYGTRKIYDRRP
jgi:hypothetical protein